MKLRKCENGHFYDEDKYAFCPHCKKENPGSENDFTISIHSDPLADEDMPTEPLEKEVQSIVKEEENLTVGFFSQKIGLEPVVGWLVCIEGEEKGNSFNLHAGRNFVGRGQDMDIILQKDMAVSRNKHAIIIYEAKNKMFLAQAGESRELFYVNDEVVLSNTRLEAYDTILIGNTKLLFVPFCCEKFAW